MVDFMNIKWHGTFTFPTNYRLFKYKVLSNDNLFLESFLEGNQMLKMLDVEYISYHVYLNDCILYIGEYADKEICPKYEHGKY